MSRPVVRLLDAEAAGLDAGGLRAWARGVAREMERPHVARSYRYPYALVAGHDWPVGVDLERVRAVSLAFAASIATPEERAALDAGEPGADLGAWAIALWSGKEALAKALGDAIDYDPRRLPSPVRWPDGRAGAWRAAELTVPEGHTAWLCWRATGR
jgi:phosphopantetheinyl transferase